MSDPLTYWWGVTLCPPELNDVSLAESVVIAMRAAGAGLIQRFVEADPDDIRARSFKGTAGISMETPPQQLLLQHRLKKMEGDTQHE